jgi:hypothetical protein
MKDTLEVVSFGFQVGKVVIYAEWLSAAGRQSEASAQQWWHHLILLDQF